jgi:hypothetical protein
VLSKYPCLKPFPRGSSVVPVAHQRGAVMVVVDTETRGTTVYHRVVWLDEDNVRRTAVYDRADLVRA